MQRIFIHLKWLSNLGITSNSCACKQARSKSLIVKIAKNLIDHGVLYIEQSWYYWLDYAKYFGQRAEKFQQDKCFSLVKRAFHKRSCHIF